MKPLRFWRCVPVPGRAVRGPAALRRARPPSADGHQPGHPGARPRQRGRRRLPRAQGPPAPRASACGSPRSIGIRAPRARPPSSCSAGCRTRCIACGAKAWTWSRGSSCATRRAGRNTRRACTRSIARPRWTRSATAPKRAAIRAFRFPFTGTRTDRAHVRLWALTPHAERTRVAVQRRRGGRWVTIRHLTANRHGMVRAEITLRGRARLRLATVRQGASGPWDAPTG